MSEQAGRILIRESELDRLTTLVNTYTAAGEEYPEWLALVAGGTPVELCDWLEPDKAMLLNGSDCLEIVRW